jgi:hypothetical protein
MILGARGGEQQEDDGFDWHEHMIFLQE